MFVKEFLEQIGEDPQFLICWEGAYYVQNGRNGIWIGDGEQLTPERMVNIAWNTEALCFLYMNGDSVELYSYKVEKCETYPVDVIINAWPDFINYLYNKFLPGNVNTCNVVNEFYSIIAHYRGGEFEAKIKQFTEEQARNKTQINGWKLQVDPLLMALVGGAAMIQRDKNSITVDMNLTPMYLSKLMADEIVRHLPLNHKEEIILFDPACGMGQLLSTVVLQLRSAGYDGRIHVIGWDIKENAVSTTTSVLGNVKRFKNVIVEISQHDSLRDPWPTGVDVVLMDPPTCSWSKLPLDQRKQIRYEYGHPRDIADVFMARLVDMPVKPQVVVSLCPLSFFMHAEYAELRRQITNVMSPTMLMKLDDLSIAAHNVSMGLLVATRENKNGVDIVWKDSVERMDTAIYAYRKYRYVQGGIDNDDIHVYTVPTEVLRSGLWPIWRKELYLLKTQLDEVLSRGILCHLNDIFQVERGINVLNLQQFCISREDYQQQSRSIQKYFHKVVSDFSIRMGAIVDDKYVFLPEGDMPGSDVAFKEAYPQVYELLRSRNRMRGIFRNLWWNPGRVESWRRLRNEVKIVVSRRSRSGEIALDSKGEFGIGNGYALILRRNVDMSMYYAYLAIMNSTYFRNVMRIYGMQHQGVMDIDYTSLSLLPIPDLEMIDEQDLIELSEIGQQIEHGERGYRSVLEPIVGRVYGTK